MGRRTLLGLRRRARRLMRGTIALVALLAACAGNPQPERAVPVCLVECPAPPLLEVVGDLTVAATLPRTTAGVGGRVVVSGEELDRIGSRRAILWVRVDAAGTPEEVRVAQTSGSVRTDRDLIDGIVDRRLPVERAGWYRTRVEPPSFR